MVRTRNVLFSILIVVALYAPFLTLAAQKAELPFPSWLDPSSSIFLSGGLAPDDIHGALSVEGAIKGKLQSAIEGKFENNVPAKTTALLGSATVQRQAIELSVSFSPFDCCPTYFGCSILYDKAAQSMFRTPRKDIDGELQSTLENFGVKLAHVARDYPEKNFVVIVADDSKTSLSNPAVRLTKGTFTTKMANEALLRGIAAEPNVFLVDVGYTDLNQYLQNYYRTDHHWNGWGAIDAYTKSLSHMYRENPLLVKRMVNPLQDLPNLKDCDWLTINGSLSRDGLLLLDERVDEPLLPLAGSTMESGTAPPVLSNEGAKLLAESGPKASFDFYQTWYGRPRDSIATNNRAIMPNSAALIICDSFGTAFKWAVLTGYGRVEARYDIHDSRTEVENLRSTLENTDDDVVYLVGRASSFQGVLSRFPDYLD